MPCVILVQVGAEPVDVVLGVVWRRLSGEKRGVCRGGRPRADRAGGGVEVHTLPSTNQQTELQHLWVSAVDGHGVVSGEWPLLTSSSIFIYSAVLQTSELILCPKPNETTHVTETLFIGSISVHDVLI